MIINAVSELPAIVINNIYDLSKQVDDGSIKNNHTGGMLNKMSLAINKSKDEAEDEEPLVKKEKKEVNYNELTDKLKDILKDTNLTIEFSMDEEVNKLIMKLIDEQKDEVVQQFPPEIAIKIAKIVASTLGSGQVADARV